jgi:preprotein translocase subunit SecG
MKKFRYFDLLIQSILIVATIIMFLILLQDDGEIIAFSYIG